MAFIKPPKNIPIIIRFIIWMEEKKLKKQLLPARILSWYPKAVIGAGIMPGWPPKIPHLWPLENPPRSGCF